MKVSYQSFVFLCLSFFAVGSFAGNNDELVPRKGLGPLDKAKVNNVQAQKWSRVGMGMDFGDDQADDARNTTNSAGTAGSYGGMRSRNCSTNVGTIQTQKGAGSGRYGPRSKGNIVVVKGDVISVCK